MKKNRIRWIIALMSIALIGIICLQVYWISHDIHLKEQQFEQTVNQAMNAIVDRIETQEAFSIMNKKLVAYADPSHITNILVLDSELLSPISNTDTDIVFPEYPPTPDGPRRCWKTWTMPTSTLNSTGQGATRRSCVITTRIFIIPILLLHTVCALQK